MILYEKEQKRNNSRDSATGKRMARSGSKENKIKDNSEEE